MRKHEAIVGFEDEGIAKSGNMALEVKRNPDQQTAWKQASLLIYQTTQLCMEVDSILFTPKIS